ncbi:MAG: alpha/beta hydrolase-fold protein [bacterium]|nr:alpha/beta hydrolase-fold protein [bacterium]
MNYVVKCCMLVGLLSIGLFLNSQAQVTIIINQLPGDTPVDDPIYMGGSFNGWEPGDEEYQLTIVEGKFQIHLETNASFEYKFTRGDWNSVEGGPNGEEIANRVYDPSDGDTVYVEVQSWKDLAGTNGSGESTKSDNVEIIEDFTIPQLNRSRRIWVCTPPEYDSSNKTYPVLYMHDGQNVFDNSTSFSGEWGVDETLNELFETDGLELVVVAVDNGGSRRIDEYAPWVNSQYGGGEGDEYVRFLFETLKPYVEANYRVSTDPNNIGIMGSSMGGHISYYAGIQYPEEFTRLGILSPAFWINPEVYELQNTSSTLNNLKLYFLTGGQEGEAFVNGMDSIPQMMALNNIQDAQYISEIVSDGAHSEWFWKREFGKVVTWLFEESDVNLITGSDNLGLKWTYSENAIRFNSNEPTEFDVRLFDLTGKEVSNLSIHNQGSMILSNLSPGVYVLEVMARNQRIVERLRVR